MRKFALLFLFLPQIATGQNTIGLPDVINYPKQTYGAGLQSWDFKQDKNGIIYIANNEGLLSFDGKYWKLYPLPNKTIVRSVEIGPDNKIYAGVTPLGDLFYIQVKENTKTKRRDLMSIFSTK